MINASEGNDPPQNQRMTTMNRYTYAFGYRSSEAAVEAIIDMCCAGEVSTAEGPRAESYRTQAGALRWRITLEG